MMNVMIKIVFKISHTRKVATDMITRAIFNRKKLRKKEVLKSCSMK